MNPVILTLLLSFITSVTPPGGSGFPGGNDYYYQQQINQLTQQLNSAQNTISQLQYQLQYCGTGSSGPILGSAAPTSGNRARNRRRD